MANLGMGIMRVARALVMAVIFMLVAPPVVPSATAWLWPILGFGHPCQDHIPKEYKPLPGTPGWRSFPRSGQAELVRPGAAFCPVCGYMEFGPVPPSAGRPCGIIATPGAPEKKKPAEEKNVTTNRSAGRQKSVRPAGK